MEKPFEKLVEKVELLRQEYKVAKDNLIKAPESKLGKEVYENALSRYVKATQEMLDYYHKHCMVFGKKKI